MIGQTITHYEILEELGRGGMGVVYKATDTKLNRTVALKFLPPHVVAAEKDRARFRREAQAAAGLSHPNIATVFAIEEADDQAFIAMEFVDGETLADRIDKGPLKVDDAIDIAIQIAEGLQVAHEQQIVHRDIKPSNIMLTSRGHVKIMDFGLAKVSQASMLTQAGSTLGTVGYMSPEQARGEEVDRRTDIWGLGCVLYQMICGRTPFIGEYEQAIVYSILNADPTPLTALRTGVPIALDGIIAKILAKDPSMRYQHVDELPADLKAVKAGSATMMSRAMPAYSSASMAPATQSVAAPGSVSREISAVEVRTGLPPWLPWGVAAIGVLAAISLFLLRPAPPGPEPVRRFDLPNFPEDHWVYDDPAISNDGTVIVYRTRGPEGALWAHHLAEYEPVNLGSTTWGNFISTTVSPSGQWLASATPDGTFRQSTRGGSREFLTPNGRVEPFWRSDADLLGMNQQRSNSDSLSIVEFTGATRQILQAIELEPGVATVLYPQILAEEDLILYSQVSPSDDGEDVFSVWALKLSTGERTLLANRAFRPRWLDNGYLVFKRGEDLHAARFDPSTLTLGASFPLLPNVASWSNGWVPHFDLSRNGVLIYRESSPEAEAGSPTVATFTRGSSLQEYDGFTRESRDHRFSPDGRKILVHSLSENSDIWLIDRDLGTTERMTYGAGEDETPEWHPDGRQFYFKGVKDGRQYLLRSNIDEATRIDTLYQADVHMHVESVSPDGRYVVFAINSGDAGWDLWIYDDTDGTSRELLSTAFGEVGGDISPDGKWIVYSSDENGEQQVYLNRFPEMDRRRTLTTGNSYGPIWSEDGRRIFYASGRGLMEMPLENGTPGTPTPVGAGNMMMNLGGPSHRSFDVLGNGEEFVVGFSQQSRAERTILKVITGVRTLVEQLDPERD